MEGHFVVVTSSFPIRSDGSEAAGSFVADLVEELANQVNVRVVAPGSAATREQWTERVMIHRYAAPSQPLSTLKPWRLRDVGWGWRVLRGGMQATSEASAGASHLLALWGLPCGEWARRAAQASGIGYSVWMLGSDVWTLGRVPILHGMLASVVRHAQSAYADGYQLAEDAQRIANTPVAFLPSTRRIGLVDSQPPRNRSPYRLLFLGRWHPNKGIDLLLDALGMLDDADWRSIESVQIQGGGPLESIVRERVAVLRTRGRPVSAGGFLTKTEAEATIVASDWVIIPSRIESIPVVFSDAIKLGRPVIATPVGDLPRLVVEGCGRLCKACTPASIADAIRHAVGTDGACDREALQSLAGSFSLGTVAARIVADAAGRSRG